MMTFTLLTLFAGQAPAPSSKVETPQARYDVQPLVRLYQQSTPKLALESAIKASEKGRYDYVAAQLLDPAFVDEAATLRGAKDAADVEADLRIRKLKQREGFAAVAKEQLIPDEPERLKPLIDAECQARGFRRLVHDLKSLAADDPGQLKELRRFLRDGVVTEQGDTASITLADTKDKAVYLKKIGTRWYVENRTTPAAKAEPKPMSEPANP